MGGDIVCSGSVNTSNTSETRFTTAITMSQTDMTSIYGIIEPDIDINVDPMEFTDIDDVLQDEETDLDWDNLQIYLTVANPTNMSLNFSQIKLKSYLYHNNWTETNELAIGSDHPETTTGDILIEPLNHDGSTVAIVSNHLPESQEVSVDRYATVPEMANMFSRIPDKIDIFDIEANALPEICWVDLDQTYDLDVQYYMLAPLCFGESLAIAYNDTLSNWKKDLKDVKGAGKLEVTLDVINKLPMDLDLTAELIDSVKNVIPEEIMTLEMEPVTPRLEAGMPDNPTTSHVKIVITCPDRDISLLDGLILRLHGSNTEEYAGKNINNSQSVTLDNVKISVMGGITFDLN